MSGNPATAAGHGLSVYIHFPFCRHRCAYCDFATVAANVIPRDTYTEAIVEELRLRTRTWPRSRIETVYFGGGTPSLWGDAGVGAVLDWLNDWGGIADAAEITLEANPGVTDAADLRSYLDVGVNRFSVGVQALADERLRRLDRVHDAATARRTIDTLADLLASGRLASASVDLILGGPGQDLASLRNDVDIILDADLPHLSVYALTVEDGTPLAEQVARGLAKSPDDGLQADMLDALPRWLADADLRRYEVSNFARRGHESRHNMAYWIGASYLAVGVGAHGFESLAGGPTTTERLGRRYGNHRLLRDWMADVKAGREPEAFAESIDVDTHVHERLLTGLRLTDGFDVASMRGFAGDKRCDALLEAANGIGRAGGLFVAGERIRATADAFVHLDGVVVALSEAWDAAQGAANSDRHVDLSAR